MDALAPLVAGGRVLVESARPDEQAEIARLRVGGALDVSGRPHAGVVLNDAGGSS